MANFSGNYNLNMYGHSNQNQFKVGDIVTPGISTTTSIAHEYLVIAVPGDSTYSSGGYFDPHNDGMLIAPRNGRISDIGGTWVPQRDFVLVSSAPQKEVIDHSKAFEYEEADEPEFDENCTIDCKPGDHNCGK